MATNDAAPFDTAAGQNNGSNGSGMDPEYLVAMVAAVLAGLAFLVASLQALLQYVTSSTARFKCSRSVIGSAHKMVKKSWSLVSWKWKYRYPIINLDAYALLDLVWKAEVRLALNVLNTCLDLDKYKYETRLWDSKDDNNPWWHIL